MDNQVLSEPSKRAWWRIGVPPAFQYPKYRAFWLGTVGTVSGFQILAMAQGWLVYELTSSPLVLGYVGAATSIPAIIFTPLGGVAADRLDKRHIVIAVEGLSALMVFIIATLTLLDLIQVWHLVVVAIVAGSAAPFEGPAGEAIYPNLIGREAMTSGVALNAAVWNGGRIVAPAAAGGIIAASGTAPAFYVSSAGFMLMVTVMFFLKVKSVQAASYGNPAQEMVRGFKFVVENRVFLALIGLAVWASLFGTASTMLMPAFAVDILEVGAEGQGIMWSASGVGALATTLWLGSKGNTGPSGPVVIGGAVAAGVSIVLFALTAEYVGSFYLAIVLMFVQGVFMSAYTVGSMSALQLMVPDHMRGRVMGFFALTWSLFPLSALQAGAMAELVGVPWAVAIGGVLVSGFALGLAVVFPEIRHLATTIVSLSRINVSVSDQDKCHQLAP